MDKVLTWFAGVWIGLAVIVNTVAMIGMIWTAQTLWTGIAKIQETYSPFNYWNWFAEIVLISPAIGAMVWREKRRRRI